MKALSKFLGVAAAVVLMGLSANAKDYRKTELDPLDLFRLKEAVAMVDEGKIDQAMTEYEALAKKYPDDYNIAYEYCFALYLKQDFKKALPIIRQLCKSPDAEELAYQMYGSMLDDDGKPKEAIKVFDEGLKRFPKSGKLYLEKGTVNLRQDKYQEALDCYNIGIEVDPMFASNYYRAANIYFMTTTEIWGLIYAETEVLLNPNNSDRHTTMAQDYVDAIKEGISITYGPDSTYASVKLCQTRNLQIDEKTNKVYLDFAGVYEGCLGLGLAEMMVKKEEFKATIPQLALLRRRAVEGYYKFADNMYGNAMELLQFQKKIIDAGHWDAYNYFLFSPACPEEAQEWLESHEGEMDNFIRWYNQNTFTLDSTHTVGVNQIFRDYHPVDLMKALEIQTSLLSDKKE